MTDKFVSVSFSGGKDSTAMLLHMIELEEPIDEVVFFDTGMEFPEMYEHIKSVEKIVIKSGIGFTTLKNNKGFEYYLLKAPIESEKYGNHQGFGWPSINSRWCTKHLKIKLIEKHHKELESNYSLVNCIGLAADEEKRLERDNNKTKDKRFPLVEWGWTEKDCLEYCYSKGFTWGGLYTLFDRVSCWCCPLQPISELKKLYLNYPDLWRQLEIWEYQLSAPNVGNRQRFFFKDELSVFNLRNRFEDELEELKNQKTLDYFWAVQDAK